MLEPKPRRRCAKNVVLRREAPPDDAPILLDGSFVARPNAQALEGNAGAHQHPQQIVIRPNQQADRVFERRVACKPSGVRVAVRADNGKTFDR